MVSEMPTINRVRIVKTRYKNNKVQGPRGQEFTLQNKRSAGMYTTLFPLEHPSGGTFSRSELAIVSHPSKWKKIRERGDRGSVEYIAQMMTHEQQHQTIQDVAGRSATKALDNPELRYKTGVNIKIYEDRLRSGRCLTCGGKRDHYHGQHPCCGKPRSHQIIVGAHMLGSERGVRSELSRGINITDMRAYRLG